MIVIIRGKDIDSDSRALKYISYLRSKKFDYKIISWDRIGNNKFDEYTLNFNYKSGYNQGGWKAVKDRIKWMIFVIKTLISIGKVDFLVLHCCDLDAAFPATIYKFLLKKKTKVIFDVFDWFSATLANQNAIIRKAFALMERFTIANSDYIIICEKERIAQIPYPIRNDSLYVLPNIPNFNERDFLTKQDDYNFNNDLLTVTYVGGLYKERCLDELITIAESGYINLLIAGYGDKDLENRLKKIKLYNIKYFGKVKYEEGLKIMYNADVIYAMYSKLNPNHLFAAPNKYYEAMFLGKPIISTIGINMEPKILHNNLGYVSEEDAKSIEKCLLSISREDIDIIGKQALHMWENKFKSYTRDFLENEYQKMITN